jgi:predicted nucleic acid-binding protein
MIAAIAHAHDPPLYTLDGADFASLERLAEVIDLG